ncbi:MAG TPA: CAP domain-containing protein [Thermoleophilaceae bacterium]|nr:CAP domain-containing protein [Thermoleophilaceae bacterium]
MRRPRSKYSIALALTIAATVGAADSAFADSCDYGYSRADQTSAKKLRLATLCLLNRERRQRGLRRLTVDPRLRLAARRHAADMVAKRYFAHVSLAGSDAADRIRAAGYMSHVSRWFVGENLVWGAGPFSTPVDRVRALMHSAPHRQNMLRGTFREVGVWVARRAPVHAAYHSGATYVLNFGAAR